MSKTVDQPEKTTRDQCLLVPSKSDFIAVLQQDSGRSGLQLEWLIDRCSTREEQA